MKVILQQDVDRLGLVGEEVEVADGYARNYLFPRRLAVQATRGARRSIELRRTSLVKKEDAQREAAAKALENLKQVSLTMRRKAGTDGKLHGSVTAQDIADAVLEQGEFELDKKQIELLEPIRSTGSYLVTVKLFRDVETQLPVKVISDAPGAELEEESPQPEEEETQTADEGDESAATTDAVAEEASTEA